MLTTTMNAPATPIEDMEPPTVHDYCDSCGRSDSPGREPISQAIVRAVLPSGLDLMLCKHHSDRYTPALVAQGARLIEATDKINVKPSISANSI